MELPSGVHRVAAGRRVYFYWHPGRGTAAAGKPVRLPDNPQSPEFWTALRGAQGATLGPQVVTVEAVIDEFETSEEFDLLSPRSQSHYRFYLKEARTAWGPLAAEGLRPVHVRAVVSRLSVRPPTANAFLGVMRALSAWAVVRDKFPRSVVEGLKTLPTSGGHKPWTAEQIALVPQLPDMVRRAVMLMLYTGQRGSDVVRLGWTDIDGAGFDLKQRKTGREVWCPIMPELAAEMATWEKRLGPFVRSPTGKPYPRSRLGVLFAEARETIPGLAGASLHGLRATAVIRLRRFNLSELAIADIVGMSPPMIKRYCRFADRRMNGEAALLAMTKERPGNAAL